MWNALLTKRTPTRTAYRGLRNTQAPTSTSWSTTTQGSVRRKGGRLAFKLSNLKFEPSKPLDFFFLIQQRGMQHARKPLGWLTVRPQLTQRQNHIRQANSVHTGTKQPDNKVPNLHRWKCASLVPSSTLPVACRDSWLLPLHRSVCWGRCEH